MKQIQNVSYAPDIQSINQQKSIHLHFFNLTYILTNRLHTFYSLYIAPKLPKQIHLENLSFCFIKIRTIKLDKCLKAWTSLLFLKFSNLIGTNQTFFFLSQFSHLESFVMKNKIIIYTRLITLFTTHDSSLHKTFQWCSNQDNR